MLCFGCADSNVRNDDWAMRNAADELFIPSATRVCGSFHGAPILSYTGKGDKGPLYHAAHPVKCISLLSFRTTTTTKEVMEECGAGRQGAGQAGRTK